MKTYTESQLNRAVRNAVTCSKILDAAALTRWAGSRKDAAEEILRSACIKRSEIRRYIADKQERKRLYALLG